MFGLVRTETWEFGGLLNVEVSDSVVWAVVNVILRTKKDPTYRFQDTST